MTPKMLGKVLLKARESGEHSQGGLAKLLGYASGQIISNAERAKQGPTPRIIKGLDLYCGLASEETIDMMGEIYKADLRAKVRAIKL